MSRVFVLGALHLDVIVNAPDLPRLDETLMGSAVSYAFGGKGGNQALAAARLGADVALAGRIGSDGFGAQLLETLSASGVDHSQIQRDPGASGMSVAIVKPGGDYGAVVVSAANLKLDADAVSLPADTNVVVLQNEVPEAVNLVVATLAKKAGATLVLNAAPARQTAPELLKYVDILVVNRVEAQDMTGLENANQQGAALLAKGPTCVLLTLGAQGAMMFTRQQTQIFEAPKVKAISTHGAGDAWLGALVAQLSRAVPMTEAITTAMTAAALHVSLPVDQRAHVTRAQIEAFRQK
ncbi:MAG: ribokinase [Sedimentitalea sp.]